MSDECEQARLKNAISDHIIPNEALWLSFSPLLNKFRENQTCYNSTEMDQLQTLLR